MPASAGRAVLRSIPAVLATVLVACGDGGSQAQKDATADRPASADVKTLRRGNGPEPDSLDPQRARTDSSLNVIRDLMVNREDVLGVLGRFAVWLTLIKLYERRSVRDYAHLLTLSLLLMMTGCLQSTDLLFGIILLLYAAMGLYVLLLYQLHMSFEQLRDERRALAPARARMAPPLKPIIGRSGTLSLSVR